ncbi:hypothetical protein SDC9_173583 [bioreactor metagenome]|uniref:Uncharacterized protein n=1 Tax=bioreactor metagenome TaxID=1076179 RepID=A0A645GJZ3_9ZZZZ
MEQDEDVLSYALFPQVAMKFFEARKAAKEGKAPAAAPVPASKPTPAPAAAPKATPAGVTTLYVEDLSI